VTLPAYALILVPTAMFARHRISLRPSLNFADWPALMRATVTFSLATAVGTMYVYAAQLLTSLVASHHQSGLFAASFRIFIVAAGVPGLVIGSALPLLSRAARDDRNRLAYVMQQITAGAGFIISLTSGHQYAGASPVLELQAFAMIGSFTAASWSFGLISQHLHRELLLTNLSALVVSIVLTLVLARSDGARGAAIATLAGESTLAVTSFVGLVRGRPQYRPHPRTVLKVLVAGAVAAAAAFIPTMPSLVRAIVVLVVYGAIILATRALPTEFRELLPGRRTRT
jgi:O-antigen/teichoic acid export membrane protein